MTSTIVPYCHTRCHSANLNYRVVMSVGSRIDIASLGTIPGNFIVKAFVPQLQLLQRAALFITHGGMNSVNEGLCAGVLSGIGFLGKEGEKGMARRHHLL